MLGALFAHVIDRRPPVSVTLEALARRFSPELQKLARRIACAATTEERARVKRERRQVRKRYRVARRRAKATLYAPIVW